MQSAHAVWDVLTGVKFLPTVGSVAQVDLKTDLNAKSEPETLKKGSSKILQLVEGEGSVIGSPRPTAVGATLSFPWSDELLHGSSIRRMTGLTLKGF